MKVGQLRRVRPNKIDHEGGVTIGAKTRYLFWVLILTGMTACAAEVEMKDLDVPGHFDYHTKFRPDWDVFDTGTYLYDPGDDRRHGIGGGRSGYTEFYTLMMDFQFKDGRTFHEEVDIKPLIKEMLKKHTIPDMRKREKGRGPGSGVGLEIFIKELEIVIEYVVTEQILEPDYEHLKYRYPLYKKTLIAINQIKERRE